MIIFIILLFLLFTPWDLALEFKQELKIRLLWFGLSFTLPTGKKNQTEQSLSSLSWEKLALFWQIYRESRIKVTALSFQLKLGTGDAAGTALISGWLWTLWGLAGPFLPQKSHFSLVPVFALEPIFKAEGSCIFRLVPGYIIFIGSKNLFEFYWKGRGRTCQRRKKKKNTP